MSLAVIVGSGRSGTHMLAHILKHSPEAKVTIEQQPLFDICLNICTYPADRSSYIQPAVTEFKKLIASDQYHFIDKTHTAMYCYDELTKAIPEIKFIGISRNPYAVVSSMLQHPAIRERLETGWQAFDLPNAFLGTRDMSIEAYKELLPVERATLCWCAASHQLADIKDQPNVYMVQYENIVNAPHDNVAAISNFLDLTEPFDFPPPSKTPLSKWKTSLTQEQIRSIDKTIDSFRTSLL